MQSAKYAEENSGGNFFSSLKTFNFLFHSVEDIKIYHFVIYWNWRWKKLLEREMGSN